MDVLTTDSSSVLSVAKIQHSTRAALELAKLVYEGTIKNKNTITNMNMLGFGYNWLNL